MNERAKQPSSPTSFAELHLEGEDLTIDLDEVARLANCGPDPKWRDWLKEAAHNAMALAQPRARWLPVGDGLVGDLFPNQTPVEAIANAGPRWAFVATIGDALELQVKTLFAESQYLEGVLLDAAGSVAADSLCGVLEQRCSEGKSSARFSPGYCSWSLEAQHTMFSVLRPEELGISLRPSLLMEPLKSVSGIVVCAPTKVLKVAPQFCRECDAKGCMRRPLDSTSISNNERRQRS